MAEDKFQKELFEFDEPKRVFPKLDKILAKNDFTVILTLEKTIFVSIGIVMLLVLVFAVGVERGKIHIMRHARIVSAESSQEKVTITALNQTAINKPISLPLPRMSVKQDIRTSGARHETADLPPVRVEASASNTRNVYTIVTAAFSKKEWADKESERLRREGFNVYVVHSNPYYLICVGSFASKDGAKAELAKIRQRYKDAYLRIR